MSRRGAYGRGGMAILVGACLLVVAVLIWLILVGVPAEPSLKADISLDAAPVAVPEAPHVQPPSLTTDGQS